MTELGIIYDQLDFKLYPYDKELVEDKDRCHIMMFSVYINGDDDEDHVNMSYDSKLKREQPKLMTELSKILDIQTKMIVC